MLHSFDIFETTLLRKSLAPSGVFLKLYENLKLQGHQLGSISSNDFLAARINAERKVREETFSEEINLEEIWLKLSELVGIEYSPRYAEIEMECEFESLYPVNDTLDKISQARTKYGRVLFISDTYLPVNFLEFILAKYQILQKDDKIYASSEHRVTKASGSLFKKVLETERISARQLIHYGDNLHSDIRVPKALGIRAEYCDAPRLENIAIKALNTLPTSGEGMQSVVALGRQYKSVVRSDKPPHAIREFVQHFAGPLCLTIATWILNRARHHGIKRLYFAARDGQMLWIAAKVLAPRFGDIDCRYIYQSRKALLLPSVLETDQLNLSWLRRTFERPTVEETLQKLSVTYDKFHDIFESLSLLPTTKLDSNEKWHSFNRAIQNPQLRDLILYNSSQLREEVLRYFEKSGLFDGTNFGVVDLGWYMTCQTAMRRILQYAGKDHLSMGFYLGLHLERESPHHAGFSESLFNTPPHDVRNFYNPFHLESKRATLLEHLLGLADHPGTVGYEDAKPVFSPLTNDIKLLDSIKIIHLEVENYCKLADSCILNALSDTNTCREIAFATINTFFSHPTEKIVNLTKSVTISGNQEGIDALSLVQPLGLKQLLSQFRSNTGYSHFSFWPEADWILSSTYVKIVFKITQHMTILANKIRGYFYTLRNIKLV